MATRIEDMTFNELVDWAKGKIILDLVNGKFGDAVWFACNQTLVWKDAQDKKDKKKVARKRKK